MPWTYTRPHGYHRTRARILTAAHGCALHLGDGCTDTADEVDAIVPESQGGQHVDGNLQAVCGHCHAIKSEAERLAGVARRSRRREPRRHPGIVE